MKQDFEILPSHLLNEYQSLISEEELITSFESLKDAEISSDTFSFYTSVAAVYSSKIEGEEIELDSYIKHKKFGIAFLPDYTKKIDDMYNAYTFAKTNKLNEKNLAAAHRLLSKHIVSQNQQGLIRTQNMYVTSPDGRIEYVAASPILVKGEMQKLYNDIDKLLQLVMTVIEVFFFAAAIHLVFVKIHPWNDGNGRTARLLEKWFIAQKLGGKAWFLQSEKYYYDQHQVYYQNLRSLGLEYEELDYNKALGFLLMLAESLKRG